ncbi:hypothetical protein, partial [Catenuloplanes indicus]
PYFVNLLSGATGFSTTALIAATLFNRAAASERAQERKDAVVLAARKWRREIHAATALLAAPERSANRMLHSSALPHPPLHAVHCHGLKEVLHMRWDGLDFMDEHTLPAELPFIDADGEERFLAHLRALIDDHIPALMRALQVSDDPVLNAFVDRTRAAVLDGRSFDAAVELREFVDLLQRHPHHAAYVRSMNQRGGLSNRWHDLRNRWQWRQHRW